MVLGVRTEGEARPWIRDVPNGIQGEHVAAGWPRWLMEVAADAVRGWQPRRADSFQKLDKVCYYDGHYFCNKFVTILATFFISYLHELLPMGIVILFLGG